MNDIQEIKKIISEAENIVFFGGAGVSTDSGIPDFRGNGGLYTDVEEFDEEPETILSATYLHRYPSRFYRYYRNHMVYPYAEPNDAHYALARLEEQGKLSAVITQNIDGLHQAAGSRNVIELHGSTRKNYCIRCGKQYGLSYVLEFDDIPRCSECNAVVRPDVVLYGESLDNEAFSRAEEAIYTADVLIVGGTSLTVFPAASLVDEFVGEHLIIINKSPTPYDEYAEYVIREPISEVMEELVD
jgi:NAD-dependent deacetylase